MTDHIISISGRPGLYKLVKQGRGMLIVESIGEGKSRFTVGTYDRVASLNDISIYCEDDDRPLFDVFASIKAHENGAKLSFNPRKVSASELHDYLAAVLPDYDRDRVHDSDIRKLLVWYNILVEGGVTDFGTEKPADAEALAEGDAPGEKKN